MKCQKCGHESQEGLRFCSNCGSDLWSQPKQPENMQQMSAQEHVEAHQMAQQQAAMQQQQQYAQHQYNQQQPKEEKASVGLAILSWFIPIAGLIIFLSKRDKQPKTAKVSGICALISFILNILIVIVTLVFTFSLTGKIFDEVGGLVDTEGSYSYIYEYEDEDDEDIVSDIISDKTNDTEKDNTDDKVKDDTDDKTTTEPTGGITNASNNWKDYQFTIGGTTLSLPCKYSDLKSVTGFSLKSADEKSYLEKGYYTTANMYLNDKLALYIELSNETSGDATYADCTVTSVTQSEYQVENGAAKITFPGGLQVGQALTVDQAKALFGEPTDTYHYDSDGYVSDSLTWSEDTDYTSWNNFEIDIVNGVIDEIGLDHLYHD